MHYRKDHSDYNGFAKGKMLLAFLNNRGSNNLSHIYIYILKWVLNSTQMLFIATKHNHGTDTQNT